MRRRNVISSFQFQTAATTRASKRLQIVFLDGKKTPPLLHLSLWKLGFSHLHSACQTVCCFVIPRGCVSLRTIIYYHICLKNKEVCYRDLLQEYKHVTSFSWKWSPILSTTACFFLLLHKRVVFFSCHGCLCVEAQDLTGFLLEFSLYKERGQK